MLKNIFIATVTIVVLIACNTGKSTKDFELPSIKNYTSVLSDSTFLSDVRDMHYVNESYFVSDYQRGQIIKLDSKLNVIATYGKTGEGPGEFKGLARFAIYEDTIYAVNEGKKSIEILSVNDSFPTRQIPIPLGLVGSGFDLRIAATDYIFLGVSDSESPITLINKKGGNSHKLGSLFEFGNKKQNLIRNNRYVFDYSDNTLISVSDNIPIVEIYDLQGKQLMSKDISEAIPIQDRLYFINNQNDFNEKSYYVLFNDVYVYKNQIYLLCIAGKEKPVANKIVVYNIESNDLEYVKTIELPSKWYKSLCITENNILVFCSSTDELQLFNK